MTLNDAKVILSCYSREGDAITSDALKALEMVLDAIPNESDVAKKKEKTYTVGEDFMNMLLLRKDLNLCSAEELISALSKKVKIRNVVVSTDSAKVLVDGNSTVLVVDGILNLSDGIMWGK